VKGNRLIFYLKSGRVVLPAGHSAGANRSEGRKVMPLIRCPSCGKSSFAFARRPYVAHCPDCGKPLNGHEDTTAIEYEIRERLYGPRPRFARPTASARD
jgi:ribosomal protein S27E